jgi:hypothetical protein
MSDRPPCWLEGSPCPNHCAKQLYQRVIYNQTPLHGPWSGWRLAGQRLVSPHREWITAPLLDRWLYRHGQMFR